MKIMNAQQAKIYNNFKYTKMNLLKTNAAIWFNKTYKIRDHKPNTSVYKQTANNKGSQATKHDLKYRLYHEIKYLYKKGKTPQSTIKQDAFTRSRGKDRYVAAYPNTNRRHVKQIHGKININDCIMETKPHKQNTSSTQTD